VLVLARLPILDFLKNGALPMKHVAVLYVVYDLVVLCAFVSDCNYKLCAVPVSLSLFNTVRSESRCALRLRYVDLVVSIEVAIDVCCSLTVFSC
jgi:hypothetical protein